MNGGDVWYGVKSDIEGVGEALADNVLPVVFSVGNATGDEDRGSVGVKLVLSEAGMWRSITGLGARSGVGDDFRDEVGRRVSGVSSDMFDRYDSGKDWYFVCGDYFMPLSIRFTLRAVKGFAESQLVDGPNIIERVWRSPKRIEVTVRLERRDVDGLAGSLHVVRRDNVYSPVPDITSMIQDLYERRDVFEIENRILKGELGVTHVVMESFVVTPGEGSSLMLLQMSLVEVDINANIISNEESAAGSGEILNGGAMVTNGTDDN